jgi:hypothetical protein
LSERRFWDEFHELIRKIMVAQGYEVTRNLLLLTPKGRLREIDIVARSSDGGVLPVEVKLDVSASITLSRLRDASSAAGSLKAFAVKMMPLLVFGAYIEQSRREWAEQEFRIQIWDRDILLQNAGQLRSELERFFKDFGEQFWKPSAAQLVMQMGSIPEAAELEPNPQPKTQGYALIARLNCVAPGRKDAKAYEAVCQDIISYLFGDHLRDVRSQKRTMDGINIYDLVYRVSHKSHPFWETLTRDFRARVVLFECKNYDQPIGAMQVLTTERYLSASALRPICFVLSRKPPHPHATQIASGAMREAGKLLVFLSDEDLKRMLYAKDAQLKDGGPPEKRQENDPTEVLDQTIYDFIAGMPR